MTGLNQAAVLRPERPQARAALLILLNATSRIRSIKLPVIAELPMEEAATLTLSPGLFAKFGALSWGRRRHAPAASPLAHSAGPDIDGDQGAGPACVIFKARMGNVIFKCPRTGMNVQHWLADEPPWGDARCSYETVTCKACSRLHFLNRSSGKLLGEQEDNSRPSTVKP